MAMLIPAYTMRFGQSFGWGGMMIFNPNDLSPSFKDMCGPGTDGDVVRSGNGNETCVFAESYAANVGVTMTASRPGIMIFARKRITIAGALNADAKGAAGGAGGNKLATSVIHGGHGSSGLIGGPGGDGGEWFGAYESGDGGVQSDLIKHYNHYMYLQIWDLLNGFSMVGNGGGGGACYSETGSTGGTGGVGGGFIGLFAPVVEITGALSVKGGAGGDCTVPEGGGGGGGGGGFIWVIARTIIDDTATYTLDGGAGGLASPAYRPGSNGDPGEPGVTKKLIVR